MLNISHVNSGLPFEDIDYRRLDRDTCSLKWIYDLANTEKSLFYRSKFAEGISRLHWSPMGIYLRVQGWRYTSFGYLFEKPIDRLLISDTGDEVTFNRVGGTSYTWR